MKLHEIQKSIQEKTNLIGTTWPLYSFVTSNPLSGFEQLSFGEATAQAATIFNANVFPTASIYKKALGQQMIDVNTLLQFLKNNDLPETPEFYLQQMDEKLLPTNHNPTQVLDQQMVKWLSLFMDEGLAEWQMPYKNLGFYKAWSKLAIYEKQYNKKLVRELAHTAEKAIQQILLEFSPEECNQIIEHHITALPGWVGYIKHRGDTNSTWQQQFTITVTDYLAVRLSVAKLIDYPMLPAKTETKNTAAQLKIQHIFLQAWEKTFQENLINSLDIKTSTVEKSTAQPDAQLVFCIDTRSELIRRHVENAGNYETVGYAGFFGIAMDYQNLDDGITRKSCPPIVGSAYHVAESPRQNCATEMEVYQHKNEDKKFAQYFLKRMKNMLPSTFGFVEGAGFVYGLSLLARTVLPSKFYNLTNKSKVNFENISEPTINYADKKEAHKPSISIDEKVAIVKSAFDLTGWETFAPLVLFVGHGSHTANNPFGSSLDCGACAASPGRHNARMLAQLANEPEVRKILVETHEINLTNETIFIGAEHNTTTDEIIIFDADVPNSHTAKLLALKTSLEQAQHTATSERWQTKKNSVQHAIKKSSDWAETRPEWGLAKNAGFVIGQRSLTQKNNMDGRCFLHSYNWKMDMEGNALEGIMQGPMVVTQWINNHYYFSTVDNNVFGGGSKITHNVTGNFGVVQGNGGDLKMGLPLQSVNQTDTEMYHQPLRLTVVIHAPLQRVKEILQRNENLRNLLDNQWIYLMVLDPTRHNKVIRYHVKEEWRAVSGGVNNEFVMQGNQKSLHRLEVKDA